jgi:LuxR family maltose regulon positive regulatory protein
MNENLLTTKIQIPSARAGFVERPRLTSRLEEGLTRKLTLIAAPAGSGKTALVSSLIRKLDIPVSWLSLDQEDNDPVHFLNYLISALDNLHPDFDLHFPLGLNTLQTTQIEAFAVPLINELASFYNEWAIVIDDYQWIELPTLHKLVAYLIEHLPIHGHIVMLTRADPPIPLSRIRTHGDMVEIRASDLVFTPDEVREFMRLNTELMFSGDEIRAIQTRTEGWAAGLKLAAISMRKYDDAASFIDSFSGSHDFIADYLTDEVLARQPDHIRSFLLQTSILDRLSGELCEAVTGRKNSRDLLETLERENLFLVSLDENREWYRYHQLFADLLCQRLNQTKSVDISELHLRASQWYQQKGMADPAIDHALAGLDFDQAAQLIEQEAVPVLKRGEMLTFLKWLDRLPEKHISNVPGLWAYQAYARLFSGNPLHTIIGIVPRLDPAEIPADGKLSTMHALLAVFQGRAGDAVRLAEQALETDSEERDGFIRSLALWSMAVGRILRDDDLPTIELFDEMIEMSTATNNTMLAVLGLCSIAKVRMREGKLQYAHDLYQRALDLSTYPHGRLYIAGQPLLGLGSLYYEWNQFEQATQYLNEGIKLARQWGTVSIIEGYFTLASLIQAQGDEAGAAEAIQRARETAIQFDVTDFDDFLVGYHHARLCILQGKYPSAKRWVASRMQMRTHAAQSEISRYLVLYEDLLQAWLFIATNKFSKAFQVLETLSHPIERTGLLIDYHILYAVVYDNLNQRREAMVSLKKALEIAEPGGYIRTLLDKGVPMRNLLLEAQAGGIYVEYVQKLLSAESYLPSPHRRLIESLSAREVEVLRLICAGHSNRQIADELIIAIGTVKAHTSSIYGKLGVNNRAQAVMKAQELDLL